MTSPLAESYLTVPPVYGDAAGGLRWSHRCDAVETADGETVALAEELAEVLAGAFAAPPVPHFAHALTAYRAVKATPAFAAALTATGLYRNAGRLVAKLCRGVPPPAGPPDWAELAAALARLRRDGERRRPHLAVEPSVPFRAFEARLGDRLQAIDGDALAHWLRHGTAPAGGGRKLAAEADTLPAWVARTLAAARRRPRLAGAAHLAPALDAALTLPHRRPAADAVPQGGYADVTTRGDPARLLPSQLALDPDEFVRRFAEGELLYFRREEPHAAHRPDRVVVLDQGVRTWGGVRLALAAAAAVLLARDADRVGRVRLVTTGGAVDPLAVPPDALADRLEASDLTPHPADALADALADPAGPRDVIVLTHPRAAAESAVRAAARGRGPGDRLFAVTVDDAGRAELSEWTPGGPVSVRTFRVDLAGAEAARAEAASRPPTPAGGWTGDREAIPFPFRPGLVGEPAACGFDADGERVVVVARDGTPHLLSPDGGPPEVLPRAVLRGAVLKPVDTVLGVRGGVVLCGVIDAPSATVTVQTTDRAAIDSTATLPAAPARRLVAAHYDFAARRVRVHDLGTAGTAIRWAAHPELHCVSVRQPPGVGVQTGGAVDLDAGHPHTPGSVLGDPGRAALAWQLDGIGGPPHALPVRTRWSPGPSPDGAYLLVNGNALRVAHAAPPWREWEPARDGKPLLAGADVRRAVLAGDVLAVQIARRDGGGVYLFRGPDGRAVRVLPQSPARDPFGLSPDGRRVAVVANGGVSVSDAAGTGLQLASGDRGRLHTALKVAFADDPFRLVIRVGTNEHRFTLAAGRLVHTLDRTPGSWTGHTPGATERAGRLDPGRFRQLLVTPAEKLTALVDKLGQVVVLDGSAENVVATFVVRRDKAAAWVPGDRFWGDRGLIGGPPSPTGADDVGGAIAAALGEPS